MFYIFEAFGILLATTKFGKVDGTIIRTLILVTKFTNISFSILFYFLSIVKLKHYFISIW